MLTAFMRILPPHHRLSGVKDPQGYAAEINVTAVTTNRPPANCVCRPIVNKDACNCLPEATVLSAGTSTTLQLMPQALLPVLLPKGRVFRIWYEARVKQTGLTCTGMAEVCFIVNGDGRQPPTCVPYNSTGAVFDAMRCTATQTVIPLTPGQ